MSHRVKRRFDIIVTEQLKTYSGTFELEKTVTGIHGILITSNRDDLIYYRGTQKVEINRQEIFPEGYETKLLMCGLNVSPNVRYYDLGGLAPGNFKITVTYTDNQDERISFSPHRVTVYLDLETTDIL